MSWCIYTKPHFLAIFFQSDGSAKKASVGSATAVKSQEQKTGGGLSPLAVLFMLLAIAAGVFFTQNK